MLTAILALLNSSALGSIIGLIGGLMNRKIDIQAKRENHEYELKKLDKQKDYLALEISGRVEVATKESEGLVESEGYKALAESYSFAAPTKEDGWVDKFSKGIRPLLTLGFFVLTIYIFYQIHSLISTTKDVFAPTDLVDIYKMILNWIFFQAGVSIGWWFAMRPGKMQNMFGGK